MTDDEVKRNEAKTETLRAAASLLQEILLIDDIPRKEQEKREAEAWNRLVSKREKYKGLLLRAIATDGYAPSLAKRGTKAATAAADTADTAADSKASKPATTSSTYY